MDEKSRRSLELHLRAAVESSPSGILMTDSEGRIVLVNREVERLFGYAREELIGKPVEILVPDKLRQGHAADRKAFFSSPQAREMGAGRDLHGRRKDGSKFPVEIGLKPLETEEGLFVLSSIVDISARKRADERFRAVVESAPSGMVMIDASGAIVLVNREAERLFGYTRTELLGQPVEILVPQRFRSRHPGFRTEFFADPSARAIGAGRDLYGLRKDGEEIPVEIGLTPIETEEGLFVLSAIVDISGRKREEEERRRLEEQLRQAQKMEAVGTLAGGIAHDFNNVLAAVVGYGELIEADVADRPKSLADIRELLRCAERGKSLVEGILAFSRKKARNRKPLFFGPVILQAVNVLRATLPPTIEIQTHVAPDAPRILGDATSVHQVLMNLATNASHAMHSGGRIEVSLDSVFVRDHLAQSHPDLHEGDYALLTVKDTGQGIDREVLDRVFEPFFTTKRPGEGTGLGLAVVHGIMKEHDGAVLLDSLQGQGTTVRCFFPSLQDDVPEQVVGAENIPRGSGERILLVEDAVLLAKVSERRLVGLGYRVKLSLDSREALELFRRNPDDFDLLITDYWMSGITGLTLAKEIHDLRPALPIVLVTGYLEDIPSEALRASGIRKVLIKPATGLELAAAVRSALDENPGG